MASETLEARLSALETEMAQLKQRLDQGTTPKTTHWVEQIYGIFADDPLFEEAVRYGREWRDSQGIANEEYTDVPT